MIKKNQANARQQLLRKNSDDSTLQYPPFQIEQCYSVVDYDVRDHSYYCLENQQNNNPYFIQLTQRESDKKVNKETEKYLPQKITMNGNQYHKIENGNINKNIQEIKALCGHCCCLQLIPKGSNKFYCYNCKTLNKCQTKIEQKEKKIVETETRQASPQKTSSPATKLFICGHCQVKVRYQPGTSQYIRCSKCNTVNMVPK